VSWDQDGQTLIIALSAGCGFCAESAPFYRKILDRVAGLRGIRVIAALPQDEQQARQYLQSLQVPVQEIKQASLADLGVKGTPTLLLVDGHGIVKEFWVGRLPGPKEQEVLDRISRNQS
jgi:hypothetical protein